MVTDHYDAKGRLLEEPDDPVDEHDLDEAQQILAVARRWIEQESQPAYDDDAQSQKWDRQADAVREFAQWLRAFVRAHVREEAASIVEAAIRRHRDTEWHR